MILLDALSRRMDLEQHKTKNRNMVVLPPEMFAKFLEQTVAEISTHLDPIAKIRNDEIETGLSPKD